MSQRAAHHKRSPMPVTMDERKRLNVMYAVYGSKLACLLGTGRDMLTTILEPHAVISASAHERIMKNLTRLEGGQDGKEQV